MPSENTIFHPMKIDKEHRSLRYKQTPKLIWFTGLSGSGKSTSANDLEKALFSMGYCTYVLDGDNLRQGLCKYLGFTMSDRIENIRRVAEVAKLLLDSGQIVLASFISPFKEERQMVRKLMEPGEFIEVYVSTPIEVCEKRDAKGLYIKARSGEISNFTGIDSQYEPPENPEIIIDTAAMDEKAIVESLLKKLRPYGIVSSLPEPIVEN